MEFKKEHIEMSEIEYEKFILSGWMKLCLLHPDIDKLNKIMKDRAPNEDHYKQWLKDFDKYIKPLYS